MGPHQERVQRYSQEMPACPGHWVLRRVFLSGWRQRQGPPGSDLSLLLLRHEHFWFPFFLNKMPGTDSLVLFWAEVELTTEQRTPLAGDADAWAGALLGLVPEAASSQPSGKQESGCLGWGAAGYDHAEASGKSSFLCSTFSPEIHVDMKDIHWCPLASLCTIAFPAPVRPRPDLWNSEHSDSTTSPCGRLFFILTQFSTKSLYWE